MVYLKKISVIILIIVLAMIFSCAPSGESDELTLENIRINNDTIQLAMRMEDHQDTLEVGNSSGRLKKGFSLVLEKKLTPPDIEGAVLQATTVAEENSRIFVSYNYAGSEFLGGVDYIDSKLKLKSGILYTDSDIHSVSADDEYIYMAGANGSDEIQAYVERIEVGSEGFSTDQRVKLSLGSYAANSVAVVDGYIYVTTGDDEHAGGGIYILNEFLIHTSYKPLHDARWVLGKDNYIYVAQGTPGKVTIYAKDDMSMAMTFPFSGASVAESKTTLDVADDRIFIAGGESGVSVHELSTGALLHTITFDESDAITNAVSAENGLVFISNGLAGVYVASYNEDDVNEAPELLGKIYFGEELSANHVLYRRGRMYVANGLGGVKMVKVNE